SNPLQIFDISDPTDPTLVGSVAGSSWTVALQVQGRYVYASNLSGNTLDIYDVSNPTAPKMVSSFAIGGSPWKAFVQGSYAYIISHGTDSLEIYDISSPSNPVYRGSVSTGVSSDPKGIDVQGNYAYVTNEGTDNLVVVDITDPTSPSSVGSLATGTDPYSISVQGRTAYVANFGSNTIGSYDVSNPTSPTAISTVSSSSPYSLFIQGRYAYATDITSTSLHIYDIGGAYIQQLETGGIETGTLSTTGNVSIGNSASIQGGLTVAGSLQLAGDIGVMGNASFINNGETDSWKTATSFPSPRGRLLTVTANGYAYVIGGYNAGVQSTVYYSKVKADGSVGSWSTAANSLPSGRYSASGVVANGYIYVIGGSDGGSVTNTVYYAKVSADGSVGTWQSATNLPVNKDRHDSVLINGYIYVLGGTPDDSAANASASVYYAKVNSDGTLGSWTTSGNSMPSAKIEGRGVVAANGYIYYTGGMNTASSATSTVFYSKVNSDGTIGTWTTASNSITAARQNHTTIVANGYMYIIGGENGSAYNTIYHSRLATDGTGAPGVFSTSINTLPSTTYTHGSIVLNGYMYTFGDSGTSDVYYTSTQRIKIGGALDLVWLNSANLSDGESATGGELTAGNTNVIGFLQVAGAANFAQGMSVGGSINLGGAISGSAALTVQSGGGNTALTLRGGNTLTNNTNGGNVVVGGGSGLGTGVKGSTIFETPTFSTATVQNFTGSASVNQANVDGYGSVLISSNAAGYTATLNDPTITTAGKILYVTNSGAYDMTLSVNGGGTGNTVALKPNTTATMIWNGSDWTAAGASSSTDLQSAYNNTLTSAGGAELVLNAA
ncbi:MAG: hypothetical protein AAB914_04085, partial [Patescibacteria group bacterium]